MDKDMNMGIDMDVDMVTDIDTWNRLLNISRPRHLPKISVIGKKSESISDIILYGEAVLFPVPRPCKQESGSPQMSNKVARSQETRT